MARRKPTGCFGFLIILLVGSLLGGCGFFFMLKPEWEAKTAFAETTCTVLESGVVAERGSDGDQLWRPEIRIRYEVDGQPFTASTYTIVRSSSSSRSRNQKAADRFVAGKTYPCWYDPADPTRVVVERGFSMLSLLFTGIGGLVAVIGGLGLAFAVLRNGLAVGLLLLKR